MKSKTSWGSHSPYRPREARTRRPWTDEERRYLVSHKTDGAELVAVALGRSPKSVRRMAERMGVSLAVRPGDVCPVCGVYDIRPGTSAAQHGMCVVCWERKRARAMQERAAFQDARRDYERQKHAARKARRDG